MANAKYTSEYGATTATNMRLSERYHHTQRTWGGDSWFTGLTELENGLSKGMWGYGDVKTHTSRTPIKELIEAVGPNSGDWAVFTTVVAGGHIVFAIGHRRGGTVHTYLSTHGQTLNGRPQSHKDDIESLGYMAKPRPCPMILNDWTAMQPIIDKQNRWRQRELAMEKYFVTQNFSFRLFTTVIGMTFGNSYAAYNRFVKPTSEAPMTFLEFVAELAFDGMHNDEDAPYVPDACPATPGFATPEDSTPGAASPHRSPTHEAALHSIIPLRLVPDFVGYKQQLCSVCNTPATFCCRHCTTSADKIFVLCNPQKSSCLGDHKAMLGCKEHKFRHPHGFANKSGAGASKAQKKAHAHTARSRAAPSGVKRKANGSRSGAEAAFDARSFRERMRDEGEDDEEEEEEEEEEDEEDE